MKTLCLFFEVHQPFRLKRYRIFDIGKDHYYYDDYMNESQMRKVANNCYIPANRLLLDLIKEHPNNFKVSFSISGIALDQFELYAPEVLESFRELARTGSVEFLAETYSHSLISLASKEEFKQQVSHHCKRIEELFGMKPKVFRNTELIYSDLIGKDVYEMGFGAMLTEGAKHILGWKSPNHIYCNSITPRLQLLLRNHWLSDDIAYRFSDSSWREHPLTCEKYVSWLQQTSPQDDCINLFMVYETIGEHQDSNTGIFEFLRHFPQTVINNSNIRFATPSQVIEQHQTTGDIHVPYPISWSGEERDLSNWLGNEIQQEAFRKLYSLQEAVSKIEDPILQKDWLYLQGSDHFYYMSTKFFAEEAIHEHYNPYHSPYDAFINYMNILSDFKQRVEEYGETTPPEQEIKLLKKQLQIKDDQLKKYKTKLKHSLRQQKSATRNLIAKEV